MSGRRLTAVPQSALRAGAYVRVSAVMGRTGEDFMSPTLQLDTMQGAAARDGARIVEVWEDLDHTGRNMDRPGLQQALEAARDGRIDRLYVYDLSRFARNAADGLSELASIERHGVDVVSATERVDRTTSSGRLTAGVLMLLAEHQSDLIGDRWKGVITGNAERGVWHGRPPQGYVRTERRLIEPDPVEGPLWAEAFRRYADGDGLRQIAVWLTAARGRHTEPNEVSRTLRSPAYLGQVVLRGRAYPGRHQPLTDQATWDRVQQRIAENARVPSRTKAAAHPLAGLLRCGLCKGRLHRRNQAQRGDSILFCVTHVSSPSTCPGIGAPRLPPIEQAVVGAIAERVVHLQDLSEAEAAVEESRRARAVVSARSVADELARTEKALGVLASKLGLGVLSDTAYQAAAAGLEETLQRLRAQQSELQRVVSAPAPAESATLAEALVAMWDDPRVTNAERNAAVRTHLLAVYVQPPSRPGSRRPRRIEIDWTG